MSDLKRMKGNVPPESASYQPPAASTHERVRLWVEIVGVIAVSVSVVLASCALCVDVQRRQDDRVQSAWSRLSNGIGIRSALEYLNEEHQDLSNIKFREVALAGIDLAGAKLVRADFLGTDLSGAELRGANLERAFLVKANMTGACLDDANLDGADFSEAILDSASLRGAKMIRCRFPDAQMYGTSIKGAIIDGAMFGGVRGLTKQQIVAEASVQRPAEWPPN